MASHIEFESILQAARTGAEWAWTRLYRDASPGILRYLRAHSAPDPEDLLGEVFVQVVRTLPSFEGGEREFHAWVTTIARNRLIDEWRKRERRPEASDLERMLAEESEPRGDAERDALDRLSDSHVRAVLGRLSPQQRDVLFMRMFLRLTVEECAQVMGKRPGAVKSLQTRAMAAIRREIRKDAVTL